MDSFSIVMKTELTIYVAISDHGFGHICQLAPVIHELNNRHVYSKLIVRSMADENIITKRFPAVHRFVKKRVDLAMVMENALDVSAENTFKAYRELHDHYDQYLAEEIAHLKLINPDVIVANVPYLILDAAHELSIPAVALCSLNWADIFYPYCKFMPGADQYYDAIMRAYNKAHYFIAPEPSMLMPEMFRLKKVGPITRIGIDQSVAIRQLLGLADDTKLVMLSMGGMRFEINYDQWPVNRQYHWIITDVNETGRRDITAIAQLPFNYIDILKSCHVFMTKPGYGNFADAVCNQVPVLYVRRKDWPEEKYLVEWQCQHNRCLEVDRSQLLKGDIGDSIENVLRLPEAQVVAPTGVTQAADIISSVLR